MKKKSRKALEPKFHICFVFLFLFSVISYLYAPLWLAMSEVVLSAVTYIIFLCTVLVRTKRVRANIDDTVSELILANKDATLNFPMATAVVKIKSNEIVWGNLAFREMIGEQEYLFEKKLFELIPAFELGWITEGLKESPSIIDIKGRKYRIYGNLFKNNDSKNSSALVTLYWAEVTEYEEAIKEFEDSRQIVSVIMFDNYAELMNGLNDSERSEITAAADKKIAEWTANTNGILIKYERDKYLYIFEERYLEGYIRDKFPILDSVREIVSKNGIKVTLSIGIGKDGQDFRESHNNARLAVDMALSRGGDQAIIRNKFNFSFFGGRSQEVEKRTKVKSRVMANALEGLIMDSSDVIIMGHSNADNDSIGAAVGIACIARKLHKRASIVVDPRNSAEMLIRKVQSAKEYENVFISKEDAILIAGSDTLVVVVDTNRKSVVESPALLESANKVAVIDHHRRGTDYIDGAVLNFHEPYASSTCELISELLQYIIETKDLLNYEAEAILSGIVIDTKRFTMKTGVRTFEAAAYLRRAGADTVELKKILQDDLESYVRRADIVKRAKMYHENIAIVTYDGESTRKEASQAADELLSISGVQASFVLFKDKDTVIVCARSLGAINVQVIIEKMGGGGHFETAGVQLKDRTIQDVTEELLNIIDEVL